MDGRYLLNPSKTLIKPSNIIKSSPHKSKVDLIKNNNKKNNNKGSKVSIPNDSHAATFLAVELQGLVEALRLKGLKLDPDVMEAAWTGMLDF